VCQKASMLNFLCLKPSRALDDALLARVRDSKPAILEVLRKLPSNWRRLPPKSRELPRAGIAAARASVIARRAAL
jgi:hypothetical protein